MDPMGYKQMHISQLQLLPRFTSPSATSRATTPRPPTPEVEPMVAPVAPVASEPLTPKVVARSTPMVGNLPSLLPGTTPPVPQTSAPWQVPRSTGSNIPVVQITPAPTLLTTPPVPDSEVPKKGREHSKERWERVVDG